MAVHDAGGREYWKWAGLGTEFAGAVALFCYLGYLVDRRYQTDPWGLVIGGGIGLLGGGYLLIKEGFRMMRTLDKPASKQTPPPDQWPENTP